MLNNTKNFVDNLDTFDKNSQQTYKKRLVKDIDETFTNTYNEPVEEEFVLNSPLGLNFLNKCIKRRILSLSWTVLLKQSPVIFH